MADIATLDGVFYQVYAKKIQDLMTDYSAVQDAVTFVSREQQNGGFYNQPVTLLPEASATYFTGSSDSMYDLNTPKGSTTQNAQVMGSQITVPSNISYAQMAKADSSAKAFVNATAYSVTNNMNIHKKRLEISFLYGQSGLATTSAVNGDSATQATVTITLASWASGIWSGMEGIEYNFYNNVTLVSSGADANFTLSAVSDGVTKTITVTGTATGITALVALTATPLTVYFKGAFGNECAGINKILTNTGSLFGIDAAVYSLWKSNIYTASGTLGYSKVNAAISTAVGRGGLMEDVAVWLNPNTFVDLTNELAALRKYDESYKEKGVIGNKWVQYFAQSGMVTIKPYALIKNGDAFVLPEKRLLRLGATDLTFERQGATNGYTGKYFLDEPTKNGVQLRSYSHQAIFLDSPAKAVKITGFTNSVN